MWDERIIDHRATMRHSGYEREGEGARLIRACDIEHAAGPAGSIALAGADRLSFSPRSGEPPERALISDSSSLFGRVNSPFPKQYSLFQCVGNWVRKLSDCGDLRTIDAAGIADFDENSL